MAFTYFFRDEQILSLAVQTLIPLTKGRRSIQILNAGCAMGMETYTFAIILAESMDKDSFQNVRIHAVDLDNEKIDFGEMVTEGIYPLENLQRVPNDLFKKYFSKTSKEDYFIVNDDLRMMVNFQKHDLLTLQILRTDYSLIICKNVLLHFNYQQRIDVLKSYANMLLKGGLLVMENTQSMPEELNGVFKRLVDYAQLYEKI